MNVVLVDTFKIVYRQLDPLKKGYIKLKDLVSLFECNNEQSEAVKNIEGE